MGPTRLGALAAAAIAIATATSALASCGGSKEPAAPAQSVPEPPAADVGDLEIRASGADRFTTCPPPGELGQRWIPPLPPWTSPPAARDAGPALPVDQDFLARTKDRTLTEIAVDATHKELRSCYLQTLVRHPSEDGRVAVVLRIAADGRVAQVESHGACGIAPEAITCMYGVARRLRFPATPAGETVTLPATFTSRSGVRRTVAMGNDAFTAAAYVAIEGARPALHVCEERARQGGKPAEASGAFTISLHPDGRVKDASLGVASGDGELLRCATAALSAVRFPSPPASNATVSARLNFNPRQGTR
jgi:hypothetical protein